MSLVIKSWLCLVAELHTCSVETALIKTGSLHLNDLILLHCMLAVLVLSHRLQWNAMNNMKCFFALFHACSVDKVFDYNRNILVLLHFSLTIVCFVHLKQECSISVALHLLQTALSKIKQQHDIFIIILLDYKGIALVLLRCWFAVLLRRRLYSF